MNRKNIAWRDQAKAQLRAIDQPTALRRLRVGDYRLRFQDHGHILYVTAVKHRREAYR